MADKTNRYRAPKFSLQVPRLDAKGEPTKNNVLVIGGGRRDYLLTDAEAAPFLESGALELVRDSEPDEAQQSGPETGDAGPEVKADGDASQGPAKAEASEENKTPEVKVPAQTSRTTTKK